MSFFGQRNSGIFGTRTSRRGSVARNFKVTRRFESAPRIVTRTVVARVSDCESGNRKKAKVTITHHPSPGVAAMPGEDEDWLHELSIDMYPEDGCLHVYGVGEDSVREYGIECLKKSSQTRTQPEGRRRAPG